MTATMPAYTQSKSGGPTDVTVQGNIKAETVKMTVSADGAAHIMSLLTDLYSDPHQAVLREYSSNALDSHKASGQTRPIEISLPSALSPNFVVEDWGLGMSTSDIRDIYSSYGKSTKRNDFSQVGAFGLGCKSALTMTQQFTIRAVKDGELTVALIGRGEDGVGEVNIITSAKTDDPNGVKVTIPVSDYYRFNSQVERFFFTWPKDSVLVDGTAPASLHSQDYTEAESGLFLYKTGTSNQYIDYPGLQVTMGGIAYQVDPANFTTALVGVARAVWQTALNRVSFVSEIPIGSVDLTPSREAIRYSPRSNAFLASLLTKISEEFVEIINTSVESATDRAEALKEYFKWIYLRRSLRSYSTQKNKKVMWNGEEFPDYFAGLAGSVFLTLRNTYTSAGHRTEASSYRNAPQLFEMAAGEHILVYTDTDKDYNRLRRNLKPYLMSAFPNNWNKIKVISHRTTITDPWVVDNTNFQTETIDNISAIAKEYRAADKATGASTPRSAMTYPTLTGATISNAKARYLSLDDTLESDIKKTDYLVEPESPIFAGRALQAAFSHNNLDYGAMDSLKRLWKDLGLQDTDRIIFVGKKRSPAALEKRLGFSLKSFADLVEKHRKSAAPSNTDVVTLHSMCNTYEDSHTEARRVVQALVRLRESKIFIGDPEIKFFTDLMEEKSDAYKKLESLGSITPVTMTAYKGPNPDLTEENAMANRILKINKKYPLLRLSENLLRLDFPAEHVMLYVNAVNATSTERTS